jgi:hypothetical protein
MEALGVPTGLILGSAKNLTTKAILKAAKKLATRTVGWLGAAVAVYEFGNCIGLLVIYGIHYIIKLFIYFRSIVSKS